MNSTWRFLKVAAAGVGIAAVAYAQKGFPWQNESLRYNITYQSGLSLGEAALTAHKSESGWGFEATVNAGIPGFAIADKFHSATGADLCSQEFQRDYSHAGKKSSEKTTFDQKAHSAERTTLVPDGGTKPGKSTLDIPSCARDALAYLYYARMELGQGRVTPPQHIWYGGEYSVRTDYTGAQNLTIDKKTTVTDHEVVSVKGPKSEFSFEVFYARDAARTPLEIRIPLPVGNLNLDLVR